MGRTYSHLIRCRFEQLLRSWVIRCQTLGRRNSAATTVSGALECRQNRSAVAGDDFESGDVDGGAEDSSWTTSGDATVRTDRPSSGNYHARLRRSTGDLQRTVDVFGLTDVQRQFSARLRSFVGSN